MNSKTESNLTVVWVNFFTAAGIPSDVSATYALTFTENRIQNDMLLDLNKEYLRDMGITRMGDVIAILRHAKQVHENTARDKVLGTTSVSNKVPVAAVTGRSTISQPSSPASRILEHYTRNPQVQEAPPSHALKRKPVETGYGNGADLGTKKARMIRFASPTKQAVKEGPSNLTVFSRLGINEAPKVVQTKITTTKAITKPIFSRLGSKGPTPAEQIIPIDKDALKYEGILKSPPLSKKMVTITTTKNIRKISCTMRADEEPLSVKDKLALPKAKSVKFSNHIQYKEIEPIKKPQVNINANNKPNAASFFNKPERRLSLPEPSVNNRVKSRLGIKNVNNLTITSTVFKRLGV